MRERILPNTRRIDEGVSLYDRDRVADTDFESDCKHYVDIAIRMHADGQPSRDIFNRHPINEALREKKPFEFMLPAGVDPHEPMKHLAKACIDVTQGYGLGSVVSVDMAKASSFDSATAMAIGKLEGYKHMGALGFIFMVMRYEDSTSPAVERLRKHMIRDGLLEAPEEEAQEEGSQPGNIDRLLSCVSKLEVPAMTLVTMEPYESAPVFDEEPASSDPDLGPGMSSLG